MRFAREKQRRQSTSKQRPRVSCQTGAANRRGRGDRTDYGSPTLGEGLLKKISRFHGYVLNTHWLQLSSVLHRVVLSVFFLSRLLPGLSRWRLLTDYVSVYFIGAFPPILSPFRFV